MDLFFAKFSSQNYFSFELSDINTLYEHPKFLMITIKIEIMEKT